MQTRNKRRNERGIALLLALIAMMLISAIGVGMLYSTNTETLINSNFRDEQRANFAALAGLQEARERLRLGQLGDTTYGIVAPTALPSTSTASAIYILNPASGETIAPWDAAADPQHYDNEWCHQLPGSSTLNAKIPCGDPPAGSWYTPAAGTAAAGFGNSPYAPLDYKWVRINRKLNGGAYPVIVPSDDSAVCLDGSLREWPLSALLGYTDCGQPPGTKEVMANVYMITSLAVTPKGSRRMQQIEVSPLPPVMLKAPVMARNYVNFSGKLGINGYDYCTCACAGKGTTTTCTDRLDAQGNPITSCNRNNYAVYAGGDVSSPNPSESIVGGLPGNTACPACSIEQNQDAYWPTQYTVDTLIKRYRPLATSIGTCSSGSCSVPSNITMGKLPGATPSNPYPALPPPDPIAALATTETQITYVGGNVTFNGGTGSGILIVDGDMNIHGGGFQFYGLILVRGQLSFTGGASAGTNIEGGILAGTKAIDSTTNPNGVDLGGSVNIIFDICALASSFDKQPLVQLSTREVPY